MSVSNAHLQTAAAGDDAADDSAIERILVIPESDALKLYARLSPFQQWRTRVRASGERRAALARYHALECAQLR